MSASVPADTSGQLHSEAFHPFSTSPAPQSTSCVNTSASIGITLSEEMELQVPSVFPMWFLCCCSSRLCYPLQGCTEPPSVCVCVLGDGRCWALCMLGDGRCWALGGEATSPLHFSIPHYHFFSVLRFVRLGNGSCWLQNTRDRSHPGCLGSTEKQDSVCGCVSVHRYFGKELRKFPRRC